MLTNEGLAMRDFMLVYSADGQTDEVELSAPNLETAYEIANAEWPDVSIIRIYEVK